MGWEEIYKRTQPLKSTELWSHTHRQHSLSSGTASQSEGTFHRVKWPTASIVTRLRHVFMREIRPPVGLAVCLRPGRGEVGEGGTSRAVCVSQAWDRGGGTGQTQARWGGGVSSWTAAVPAGAPAPRCCSWPGGRCRLAAGWGGAGRCGTGSAARGRPGGAGRAALLGRLRESAANRQGGGVAGRVAAGPARSLHSADTHTHRGNGYTETTPSYSAHIILLSTPPKIMYS